MGEPSKSAIIKDSDFINADLALIRFIFMDLTIDFESTMTTRVGYESRLQIERFHEENYNRGVLDAVTRSQYARTVYPAALYQELPLTEMQEKGCSWEALDNAGIPLHLRVIITIKGSITQQDLVDIALQDLKESIDYSRIWDLRNSQRQRGVPRYIVGKSMTEANSGLGSTILPSAQLAILICK
jgi:hypothetical protein